MPPCLIWKDTEKFKFQSCQPANFQQEEKPHFQNVNKDSEGLPIWRYQHARSALAACAHWRSGKPQCPLWAQAYLGDYYPCLLPPKQFTCDSNGRFFFFFKCLKERPDSLEATGLYLKETVWHLQGKGHFFTPLKRIDNNNRENIQQEELHFPRPPGETVTQLWDWFYEPVR